MNVLALDIGTRRTGIAFADSSTGIPLALSTIAHTSMEEHLQKILMIVSEKKVDVVVIGLPLLPSGEEGSQVQFSRSIGDKLKTHGLRVEELDERYSTPSNRSPEGREIDKDSASACGILQTWLDRNQDV